MQYSQAYKELVDYLVSPYFEATGSGEIVLTNKALEGLVGDVCGKRIWEIFSEHFESLIKSTCEEVRVTRRNKIVDLTLQAYDGADIVQLDLAAVNHSDADTPVHFRGKLKSLYSEEFLEATYALERQAAELEILNHLSEVVSSSLEIDDILHSICRETIRVFNARNVGIALLNEKKDGLKVVAFFTDQDGESDVTGLEFSLAGNDASLFVIRTGEPIVVPDAQFNPITRSIHNVMKQRGTTCLMVIPLLARGEVIGTIGIPSNSQEIFSQEDVRLAMTIASQVASVIDNARLHQSVKRARDAAEKELEIGRQIQTSFFPETIPELSGWQIYAYFKSARQVSGDFYDVFALEDGNKQGMILADVCDKGVGAALFMVLFRSLLRANLMFGFKHQGKQKEEPDVILTEAVAKTNNYVANNHARANMFATVFAAVIEKDRDKLWYTNCGHDAPILFRNSGEIERFKSDNPAIGMFPNITFHSTSRTLQERDSVVAFTDGVLDARSMDGEGFGEERLLEILAGTQGLQGRQEALAKALDSHIADAVQFDDITCLSFERTHRNGR